MVALKQGVMALTAPKRPVHVIKRHAKAALPKGIRLIVAITRSSAQRGHRRTVL